MNSEPNNAINKFTIDELFVGQKEKIDRIISAQDIKRFSELTNDYHPLHTNNEYAVTHGFDGIIAHGLLLSSYTSALIGMRLPGENTIVMKQCFEYHLPVYADDSVTITGTVKDIQKRFNFAEITVEVMRKEALVCSGSYQIKIRK